MCLRLMCVCVRAYVALSSWCLYYVGVVCGIVGLLFCHHCGCCVYVCYFFIFSGVKESNSWSSAPAVATSLTCCLSVKSFVFYF